MRFHIDGELLADTICRGMAAMPKRPQAYDIERSLLSRISLNKTRLAVQSVGEDIVVECRIPVSALVNARRRQGEVCIDGHNLRCLAMLFRRRNQKVAINHFADMAYRTDEGVDCTPSNKPILASGELCLTTHGQLSTSQTTGSYPLKACPISFIAPVEDVGLTISAATIKDVLAKLATCTLNDTCSNAQLVGIHCYSGLIYMSISTAQIAGIVELYPDQASRPTSEHEMVMRLNRLNRALDVFDDREALNWGTAGGGSFIDISSARARCQLLAIPKADHRPIVSLLKEEVHATITVQSNDIDRVLSFYRKCCNTPCNLSLDDRTRKLRMSAMGTNSRLATDWIPAHSWRQEESNKGRMATVHIESLYQLARQWRDEDIELSFGDRFLRIQPVNYPQYTYFLCQLSEK